MIQVIVPGHTYEVQNFENANTTQTIQFIHKEPTSIPGELKTISDGTTNESLLAVLIDRMNFLNGKFPCRENAIAITNLEQALMWLEKRTRDRVARGVEGTHQK
jgi:hypothetical protein